MYVGSFMLAFGDHLAKIITNIMAVDSIFHMILHCSHIFRSYIVRIPAREALSSKP